MPTPVIEVVHDVLEAHGRGAAVFSAINLAWEKLRTAYPDRAWWRRRSTRAAIVWEHAVANLIESIHGSMGARIISHHDTVSFVFDELVFLRLKKANIELRTSNYPTKLAQMYHTHREDLFGYDGLHRVEAAYVLNRFETRPDWIGIVARERHRRLWHFELGSAGAVVTQLPLAPQTEPAADSVVKIRNERRDETGEEHE